MDIQIAQTCAILIDGNNIDKGIHEAYGANFALNYDAFVPRILKNRQLRTLYYFREGKSISPKLTQRLADNYFGITIPCHKSADVQLVISAIELIDKVDTIILLSGDVDFLPLIQHLQSRGIRTEVAAMPHTVHHMVKETAHNFMPIMRFDTYEITKK